MPIADLPLSILHPPPPVRGIPIFINNGCPYIVTIDNCCRISSPSLTSANLPRHEDTQGSRAGSSRKLNEQGRREEADRRKSC